MKKFLPYIGYIALALLLFFGIEGSEHFAFAVDEEGAPNLLVGFGTILSMIIHMLVYVSWIVIGLIGPFLSNDIVLNPTVVPVLHELWTVIRDIVNVGFVFVLIAIAFKQVLQVGGSDNAALKTTLPKFVLSLIGVNFSWLAMKVILDFVTVLTALIFSLPGAVNATSESFCAKGCPFIDKINIARIDTTKKSQEENKKILERVAEDYLFVIVRKCTGSNKTCEIESAYKYDSKTGKATSIKPGEVGTQKAVITLYISDQDLIKNFSPSTIAPILAYNMLNLDVLGKISKYNDDMLQMIINALFQIMFAIIYAIVFIALFVALLARVVIVWFAMIFSPVAFLAMSAKDIFPVNAGGDIAGKVLHEIFVPVKVAIPMVIGFILMIKLNSLTIDQGPIIELEFTNIINNPLQNLPFLMNLLMQIMGVAVLWLGVRAAMDGGYSKAATDMIFDGAKKLGATTGKLVASATPIAPIVTAPAVAKGTMDNLLNRYKQNISNKAADMARTMRPDLFGGHVNADKTGDAVRIANELKGLPHTLNRIKSILNTATTPTQLIKIMQESAPEVSNLSQEHLKGVMELMADKMRADGETAHATNMMKVANRVTKETTVNQTVKARVNTTYDAENQILRVGNVNVTKTEIDADKTVNNFAEMRQMNEAVTKLAETSINLAGDLQTMYARLKDVEGMTVENAKEMVKKMMTDNEIIAKVRWDEGNEMFTNITS